MNSFLEKLTNNVDIEPVAQEYIDFLLSCNKGKVIYRDASFSDKDYILGTKRPWATEHLNIGIIQRQESPGASWINARKEYDNFFKNNFRIVDVRSGATRCVTKSKRKPYEMIQNKVVICDIIDHIIFLGDDVLCPKLRTKPE